MSTLGPQWHALVRGSLWLVTESLWLVVGLLSGAIFFGGLWWTVRMGTAARNPALWFPISLLLRASLVIVGFYYAAAAGWLALLLCAAGFLAARAAIFRLIRVTSVNLHAS
jgi:F1F0 ATPase subunit 2